MGAREWPHRGDQPVAHARDQESPEAAVAVGDAQRGVTRAGELPGRVDETLQHLVDRELRGDGQHGVADGAQYGAEWL